MIGTKYLGLREGWMLDSNINYDCPKCNKIVKVTAINTGIVMYYYCKECGELVASFSYD